MNGDQIFWLLRGAQFLPLDAAGPARRHHERPQQELSASTQDARRSTRKRIAGFLGRA
jgi:hypothetical protein